MAEVPGNGPAGLLGRGVMVTEVGMGRLESSRNEALGWVDRAQPHRELGLAAFADAQSSAKDDPARRPLLEQARDRFRQALALAPVDPQSLAMLMAVEADLGEVGEARKVMAAAHAVARVSPEFSLIRSALAMRLWPELSEPERELAMRDFAMAWRTLPRPFLGLTRRAGFFREVRQALAGDSEQAEAFEKALAQSYVYPQPASGR